MIQETLLGAALILSVLCNIYQHYQNALVKRHQAITSERLKVYFSQIKLRKLKIDGLRVLVDVQEGIIRRFPKEQKVTSEMFENNQN